MCQVLNWIRWQVHGPFSCPPWDSRGPVITWFCRQMFRFGFHIARARATAYLNHRASRDPSPTLPSLLPPGWLTPGGITLPSAAPFTALLLIPAQGPCRIWAAHGQCGKLRSWAPSAAYSCRPGPFTASPEGEGHGFTGFDRIWKTPPLWLILCDICGHEEIEFRHLMLASSKAFCWKPILNLCNTLMANVAAVSQNCRPDQK